MNNLMLNDYQFNSKFRKAVDQFISEHGCTLEEALQDSEIKRAWVFEREL